jgi:hypothetical protein
MNRGILKRWLRFGDRQVPKRGWFCPDEAELAAFLEGKLAGEAKERMVHHLADCSHCLAQVAELSRLQAEERPVDVPAPLLTKARGFAETAHQGPSRPLVRWGAIAAAVACVALVVVTTHHQPPPPPALAPSPPPQGRISSPTETPPQPEARRAVRNLTNRAPVLRLLHPREGSTIAPGDIEFRWQDVPGVLYYDVRVVTDEGDVIWEGRTEKARTSLPPDIQLTAGQEYYVRVRAWLAEGKTVTSGVVSFKVKNPS